MPTVLVSFATTVETHWGDAVVVVGPPRSLGSWQPSVGMRLSTNEGIYPVWRGSVSVDVPMDGLEWKMVIIRVNGDVEWEPIRGNRQLHAGIQVEVTAAWGKVGHGSASCVPTGGYVGSRAASWVEPKPSLPPAEETLGPVVKAAAAGVRSPGATESGDRAGLGATPLRAISSPAIARHPSPVQPRFEGEVHLHGPLPRAAASAGYDGVEGPAAGGGGWAAAASAPRLIPELPSGDDEFFDPSFPRTRLDTVPSNDASWPESLAASAAATSPSSSRGESLHAGSQHSLGSLGEHLALHAAHSPQPTASHARQAAARLRAMPTSPMAAEVIRLEVPCQKRVPGFVIPDGR